MFIMSCLAKGIFSLPDCHYPQHFYSTLSQETPIAIDGRWTKPSLNVQECVPQGRVAVEVETA